MNGGTDSWKHRLEMELAHEISRVGVEEGFIGETKIALPTELFEEYIKDPIVRRLYLTDVCFYPHAEHHYRERQNGARENVFFYCIKGHGFIDIKDKHIELKEGEAFCIPLGVAHRYYAAKENPWSILWVHFKGEDAKYYPLDSLKVVNFNSDYATNRMMLLFDLLFRVLNRSYTIGNFEYISQVLGVILSETYMREKNYEENRDLNKHISDMVKYLSANIGKRITLDELSDKFKLSKSYINELFLRYTKYSPIDFFIRLKMDHACKLLKATDMRIYEIASEVGYSDQYFFSRVFKQVVGVPPKKFREDPVAIISPGEI